MLRKENLVNLACLVILLGCIATTCGCGRTDTTTTHKLEIDAGSVYDVIQAVHLAEEENKADTAQSMEEVVDPPGRQESSPHKLPFFLCMTPIDVVSTFLLRNRRRTLNTAIFWYRLTVVRLIVRIR